MQITPLTTLQKLLSVQSPIHKETNLLKSSSQKDYKRILSKDLKNELINALKQKKLKPTQLNQLLQPKNPIKEIQNGYKRNRPPQLEDFCEIVENQQDKQVFSSKSVQKSPKIGVTKGFFTSTNRMNVFGSLNEALRQYIGKQTGKGQCVKLCQSARNVDIKNYSKLLKELYLRTSKILNEFQTKETLWKQEKQSLREELQFLKQLLKQQQDNNKCECLQ